MPYQVTHTNDIMPRAAMLLFRILSHRSGIILGASPPPIVSDYQIVTKYLSDDFTHCNTGQISIFLSFFYGKRAGFFVRNACGNFRKYTEALPEGFAISRKYTEILQEGSVTSRKYAEALQEGFVIYRKYAEALRERFGNFRQAAHRIFLSYGTIFKYQSIKF